MSRSLQSHVRGAKKSGSSSPRNKNSRRKPLVFGIVSAVLVAGGGLLPILSLSTNSCRGATRPGRVRWQQTSAEINEALAGGTNGHYTHLVVIDSVPAIADDIRVRISHG